MKKILLFASALAGLFLAGSCQRENLEPAAQGGVTYEISLPDGPQTKGETGYEVYDLHYEVYRINGTAIDKLYHNRVDMEGDTTTLPLDLLNDQTYTVIFWAQEKGSPWIDASDLQNIQLIESLSNNDHRDAFCGIDANFAHDGAESRKVTLTRPFAQVNIATTVNNVGYDITPKKSLVTFKNIPTGYNLLKGKTNATTEVTFGLNGIPGNTITVNDTPYTTVAMNYVLVADSNIDEVYYEIETDNGTVKNSIPSVPVKKNYRTNIIGNLLTSNATYTIELLPGFEEGEYTVENGGNTSVKVTNTAEFIEAFADENMDVIVLGEDINLNDLMTRAAADDPTFTVKAGKTLTIDLNGKKLSATSEQVGKNYNMFDVRGTLTVKNGTIEYKHLGENMGWGHSTNIFNVTAGGVLNLKDITAKNLGGSDMGFVAHLNNWGEVTLNAENCTLESNYVPVRVFNSGYDMNNVTIKNSTLKGVSAAFWVHNYTVEDFGSAEKAEAQKALLNLSIYNQGNTFSPDVNGVRYGFTNSVRSDAYGITKTVSEDGSVVTLGSVVENGLVRRGVAGTEENTTITKAIVGDGITTLYDRTFRRFYALETVELPSTLTTIGAAGSGVFQSCTSLKNITIPESVTVIGKGTFQECSSLKSINIPAGVTRIEENALRATGLVSVEFHEGVTYFGAQAFRDCKQLKEVIINAPEFTIEANAFGSMAAPYPAATIYVANAEMKTYLESTLTYANQFAIVAPNLATSTDELKNALATDAKIVNVAAGEYTFPASSVKTGTTIVCAEGTVFTGTSSLNINGATVVGATFRNEDGQAVSGTINGTFKGCTFEGSEALRWCYTAAGVTAVFENCVINTDFRGFHFDDMAGDVVFRKCVINGFNAYGGNGTVTFEGCTFGNDESKYNGLNIYSNTVLKNCSFVYVSGKTNFIDMEGTGKTLTIENCTATLDGAATEISNFIGGSKLANNTVVIK